MTKELLKPGDEPIQISHFVKSAQEKMRKKIVFDWLSQQLKDTPLTREQLEERFTLQFCERTPKILELSGVGYRPQNSIDLHQYLEHFVKQEKFLLIGDTYALPEDS